MSTTKRDGASAPDDATTPAVFDLGALAYAPIADMEVENPITNEPTGWVITFAGPGHPKTVALNDELARKAIATRRRREEAQTNGRKWKADDETPKENREANASGYARRILDWKPAVKLLADEPPLEFSEANATRILANPDFFWLYRDVAVFLAGDAGFIEELRDELIAAAQYQFEMNIPDKTGHSNRANIDLNRDRLLRRIELGAARPTDEAELDNIEATLSGPPLPAELSYVYFWFMHAAAGRSSNGFGPNALSASEILAWSQLTGHRLTPWEFDLMRELDGLWLSIYAELHKPEPPKKNTIDK